MRYSIHDDMSLLEFKPKWTYTLIHPCRCIVVVGFQTDCQVASGGSPAENEEDHPMRGEA